MAYITSKNGSRQPMFLITTGILLLLSTIAVSLRQVFDTLWSKCLHRILTQSRLYCRLIFIRHVGLDDYFMLAALVVAIALGAMNGFHVSWGTGYAQLQTNLATELY